MNTVAPITRRMLLLSAASLGLPASGARAAAEAMRPRPLVFPRDHGTHNGARTEWWYLTGHAKDSQGRDFGFQITFFRSRVDEARALPGRLAARQLLFAHAAITDVAGQRLHHDERIARWNGEPPTVRERGVFAREADTEIVLRDWFLRRRADGGYSVGALGERLLIDLEADSPQAWLLQGDGGFSRKGPEPSQASFYISQPQLRVRGTLGLAGQRFEVTGTGWLDHEWSEALMHPEAVGWDWIGMNLFDGQALTAFRLRRADGSALWAGGSLRTAADAQNPHAIRRFAPGEVEFRAQRWWTSPLTRTRYPVEWAVRTPTEVYTVRALADAQELDSRASTGAIYWEGLCELLGSQGRVVGRGYLEMTGYASRLVL